MSTHEFDDTTDDADDALETEVDALFEADDSSDDADTGTGTNRLELAAQVELLAEENRRLRTEYARARQSRYRRTALGLLFVGLAAVGAGVLFADNRDVLVAIGATGLFAGILTYYLTPGQFVAAAVGERVYAACAQNQAAIATELGLHERYYYVPTSTSTVARLFVPQTAVDSLEDGALDTLEAQDGPFVLEEDHRGLLLETTGGSLFREFERGLSGDVASTPSTLAVQLCDGLLEQFELATRAEPDVDAANGRVTVAISGSAFGDLDRFDHPIPSFLATGFARGLERPVSLEVVSGDERADWLVTCRFESESTQGIA